MIEDKPAESLGFYPRGNRPRLSAADEKSRVRLAMVDQFPPANRKPERGDEIPQFFKQARRFVAFGDFGVSGDQ